MNQRESDWIERAVALATRLGFNPVRTRWKLNALSRKLVGIVGLAGTRVRHAQYEHTVCPVCDAVQDRHERTCSRCSTKLPPRSLQILNRLSAKIGRGYSNTFLLGVVILSCFWRSCIGPQGFDLALASNSLALLYSGGSISQDAMNGEWWRLLTSVFLHGGALHLIFNMIALKQIGPSIEAIFGRGRMLFFFVVTGILASLGSSLLGGPGVRIGASGAIMGMIGVAAGWGQRLGTTHGVNVRNQMLQWALYTIIYGYVLSADNLAHAVGLVAGVAIGYLSQARSDRESTPFRDWLLTLTGSVLVFSAVVIIMLRPPILSALWREDIVAEQDDYF